MCNLKEIEESVKTILKLNKKLSILHCVSNYPTEGSEINLNAINTLKKKFPKLKIGFSDHTIGPLASLCAAVMGADIIEKHFTYDKNADGPDHMLSLDFVEMKWLVSSIRQYEEMTGHGKKIPTKSEIKNSKNNRKSLVAIKQISKGEKFSSNNLGIKRPGYGIKPSMIYKILNKVCKSNINYDDVIKWSDVQ